jgi:lipopolysaccharide export system permease protein
MKRVDRLILKELWVPFLIGTITVLLLFQANQLIYLFKTYSPTAVPWTATVQMLVFDSPKWLAMSLTMGTSLATALAISRLARESEITAIRSIGVPIFRIMMPVVCFGFAASLVSYVVSEYVQPVASKSSKKLAAELYLKAALPDFTSNVTVKLNNRVAIIGTVSRVGENSVALSNVLLYEKSSDQRTTLTTSTSGKYSDGIWLLDSPKTWIFEGEQLLQLSSKDKMEIIEPITIESLFAPSEPDEQTSAELHQGLLDARKQGADTRRLEVAIAKRLAIPASCVVLALVSPIFAILFSRSGAFIGVLFGVLVSMAYYNVFIISTDVLGPNGFLSPWLAAWMPNILFFVVGMIGVRKLE